MLKINTVLFGAAVVGARIRIKGLLAKPPRSFCGTSAAESNPRNKHHHLRLPLTTKTIIFKGSLFQKYQSQYHKCFHTSRRPEVTLNPPLNSKTGRICHPTTSYDPYTVSIHLLSPWKAALQTSNWDFSTRPCEVPQEPSAATQSCQVLAALYPVHSGQCGSFCKLGVPLVLGVGVPVTRTLLLGCKLGPLVFGNSNIYGKPKGHG